MGNDQAVAAYLGLMVVVKPNPRPATRSELTRTRYVASWPELQFEVGQGMSRRPDSSDIDLFCYHQSIVHLDAEIPNRTYDLGYCCCG